MKVEKGEGNGSYWLTLCPKAATTENSRSALMSFLQKPSRDTATEGRLLARPMKQIVP